MVTDCILDKRRSDVCWVRRMEDSRMCVRVSVIEEKNSYLADREKDGDGKLRTNKDKAGHGIGMQSIEKIVRNFDGVYLYDFDNETHIFWSKISLPYQKC